MSILNLDDFVECEMCGESVQGHDVVEDGLFGNLCPRCGNTEESE